MFEQAAGLWDDYCVHVIRDPNSPLWDLGGEVAARLVQLDMVLEYLEGAIDQANASVRGPAGAHLRAWDEIVLFSETFYFIAWRMLDVLQGGGKYKLPGMSTIEARGIRDVRNHLIQHPEKTKLPRFGRYYTLSEDGLIMKGLKTVVDETGRLVSARENIDRGLLVNAAELRDALVPRIERALALNA